MDALFKSFNPIFEGRSGNWDVDLRNFLEVYLQELHNETGCSSMINFSHAAIVLQKSVYVYEKKVDYLSQLVMQLLDVVQLSKSGTSPSKSVEEQSVAINEAEPSTSKKTPGRKSRSNKPYLSEEFSEINCKVSVKSLDLAPIERTSSKPELTLTRSAVFGRMVNIKKKRQHELYVFDKNEECMGKKDDFRLSWSLNHQCVLVEDPFDESVGSPPPVSTRLDDPISCDSLEAIPSPVSPSSVADCVDDCAADDPAPTTDARDANPLSPNQEVPSEQNPGQVSNKIPNEVVTTEQSACQPPNENLNQEFSESQNLTQEAVNENTNQEVPVEIPQLAGPSVSAPFQDIVLPDTPPDSQVLRSGPAVEVRTPRLSIIEENEEEVAVVRRSLRERNVIKEGDNLNPLNFLFSSSLLQTLDDSADSSTLSSTEKVREQAKKVLRKGKRRFREILDEEEGLTGFDEVTESLPADAGAATIEHTLPDLPPEEVPQLNVPVPTPPPTPSNSQPMSPDPVSRTPRSDIPETRCPVVGSPRGGSPGGASPGGASPGGASPDGGTPIWRRPATPRSSAMIYSEEPADIFDPYGTTESDRSARVAAWHKSIKQRLEEANARPPFDVHVYGSKVISAFPSVGTTLDFKDIVTGMDQSEIARIFLTSLMLANTENVEISLTESTPLPVDGLSLKLLSTQRHEEELEAFCAPSVDIQRRSNTESPSGLSSGLANRKRKPDSAHSRSVPHKKRKAKGNEIF